MDPDPGRSGAPRFWPGRPRNDRRFNNGLGEEAGERLVRLGLNLVEGPQLGGHRVLDHLRRLGGWGRGQHE